MTTADQRASSTTLHPGAAVASWLIPGAGHLLLGQRKRGLILGLTIGLLWLGGWFIGGVSIFDYTQHRAWFAGQMLTAPSVIVAITRNQFLTQTSPEVSNTLQNTSGGTSGGGGAGGGFFSSEAMASNTTSQLQYEPSFGRVSEIGILYTALAGLLNLLSMIDVLWKEQAV